MERKAAIGVHLSVERALGKGAFGEVCLARPLHGAQEALSHGRPIQYPPYFAVKFIHGKLCNGITLKEIEREMDAVDRFSHPHIVQSIDNWLETGDNTYKGCFCLAMKLYEGGDLHQYISQLRHRRSFPSPDCVVRIMTHVLSALNHSHSKGVIHRDIKPGNVFLEKEGNPRDGDVPAAVVGDFGLSRPLDYATQLVKTRVGTPGYFSPEIVNGVPYNFKTDLFSAGVLMYELMALERPFWKPHYSASNTYWATVSVDPIPHLMRVAKNRYSTSLCHLVSALISKSPDDRPTAFEALTQFSGRIARVVHDERVPVISDDVVLAEPCSAAVIAQKPVKGPEALAEPQEDARKSSSPFARKEEKDNVSPGVSPRRPAAASPEGKAVDRRTATGRRLGYTDHLAGSPRAALARTTCTARAQQKLKLKPTSRGASTAVRADPAETKGHPYAWALTHRTGVRPEQKWRAATPVPRGDLAAANNNRSATERLKALQGVLLSPPFASAHDEELWKVVGQDTRLFLFAKLAALGEERGEEAVTNLLKASGGKNSRQRDLQGLVMAQLG